MANLSTTVSWDTIRSITNPKVSQKIADNITANIPLLYMLDKQGNKEYEDGGDNYQIAVFKELSSAQAYTGLTSLNSPEADPFTSAFYERKQLTTPIVATGTKMLKNSGSNPEAVVNYLTAIIEAAEESMKNAMAGTTDGIFSSNGESDLGITGLQNIVDPTPSVGTTGGLNRATYSWWRNYQGSCATGFSTNGLASFHTAFYNLVRGMEKPDVIVTTRSAYINLNRAMTATLSFNIPSPKTSNGDLSFENILFHGVPVLFDENCPANSAYFLNLKYLKFMVHRDRDMVFRDWITPGDQDGLVARMYWAGNLICSRVAAQGIVDGSLDTY